MDSETMHIVVFPWLAFGHMIPFLELSKRLASKGHRISFVSSPRNLQRLPRIPQNLAPLISLVPLPLPRDDQIHDLPLDAEATMDVPVQKIEFLKKAYDRLEHPMSRLLEMSSPVDWIIYDFSNHWLPPIADRFGIRKAMFFISNAWTISIYGSPSHMLNEGGDGGYWTKPENFTKPPQWVPFASPVVCRLHEAKQFGWFAQKNASSVSDLFRLGSSINGCDLFALRSCEELEAKYLQLLEKLYRKPVVPVGLLPVSVEDEDKGDKEEARQSILSWLDKQKTDSVVYVALGSEVVPSQDQITELALGLEQSQMPFFWAWRKPAGGSIELPDGFEERTRDQGMVFKKWAPQPRILSHNSVGAFLTHSGWGSVVEGLQFGRPLIWIPLTWDLNMRALVEKKVGIEIPTNDKDGSFTRSSVAESLKVLLQDETANGYREEARKISGIFGNENLQCQYIDRFEACLKSMKQTR